MAQKPLRIRQISTGAEYECASLHKFALAYADNDDWVVINPPPVHPLDEYYQMQDDFAAQELDAADEDDADADEEDTE